MELTPPAADAATTSKANIELVGQTHQADISKVFHATGRTGHFTGAIERGMHRRRNNTTRMVVEKLFRVGHRSTIEFHTDFALAHNVICRSFMAALAAANAPVGISRPLCVNQNFHVLHYGSIRKRKHLHAFDEEYVFRSLSDHVLGLTGTDLETRRQSVDDTSSQRVIARPRQIAPGGNRNESDDKEWQYPGQDASYPVQAQPFQLHRRSVYGDFHTRGTARWIGVFWNNSYNRCNEMETLTLRSGYRPHRRIRPCSSL